MHERLPAGLSPRAEPSPGWRTTQIALWQALPHYLPGLQTGLSMLVIVLNAAKNVGCERLYHTAVLSHSLALCEERTRMAMADQVQCLPLTWSKGMPHRTHYVQLLSQGRFHRNAGDRGQTPASSRPWRVPQLA